jgi:antitoxin MazE
MNARIQRWGNSLALRIPRPVAQHLGLVQNSLVHLSMTSTRLTVVPAPKERPSLDQLLSRVTRDNLHKGTETGRPVGRETW